MMPASLICFILVDIYSERRMELVRSSAVNFTIYFVTSTASRNATPIVELYCTNQVSYLIVPNQSLLPVQPGRGNNSHAQIALANIDSVLCGKFGCMRVGGLGIQTRRMGYEIDIAK